MLDIKNELKNYINNNLIIEEMNINKKIISDMECYFMADESIFNEDSRERKTSIFKNSSIKDYIDEHEEYSDFQSMLFKLIDERNLKDSDVYNKVHIDRRLFSKIRSDKNYHPSKETIILLGIALELEEFELDNLLDSASYSLPKNNKYDLIIRFCFINKIFKLKDINELLYEYNCKLFNY